MIFLLLVLGVICLILGAVLPQRTPWNQVFFVVGGVLLIIGLLTWVSTGVVIHAG
jgi:hypothetical protein